MKRSLLILAAMVFLAADTPPKDAAQNDLDLMQGDWQAMAMVRDGAEFPPEDAQALFRSVKGGDYSVFRYNKAISKGKLTLDPTTTPKSCDARITAAGGKEMVILGIYEVTKDKMKLCFASPGAKDRPKSFEAPEGSGLTMSVWVREEK